MTQESIEDVEFIDLEATTHRGGNEGITIKSIILGHNKKVADISTEEFKGSFKEIRTRNVNGMQLREEVIKPDARARYCQAVDTLYDLLFPFFDISIKKQVDSFIKEEFDCGLDRDKLVKVKRKMYRELNCLLHRLGYLGED